MKRVLFALSVLFMAHPLTLLYPTIAQVSAAGQDNPYGQADYRGTIKNVVTEVAFYTPSIVNVRKYMTESNVPRQQLAVTLAKQDVAVEQAEVDASTQSLKTSALDVRFNTRTGQIKFYTSDGTQLLSEKASGTVLTACQDGSYASYKVSSQFTLTSTEQIYGLGQLQNNRFNQRDATYSNMIEGNMSVWIPYFYSTKG